MRTLFATSTLILTLALIGCGDQALSDDFYIAQSAESQTALTSAEGHLPTHTYYSVRRDYRRCMFPRCGGYFVSQLNRRATRCGDGTRSTDGCYVAEMTLPGVTVATGDVVHGTIIPNEDHEGYSTFEADVAYASVLAEPPTGMRAFLIHDTGIRCITTPCPSHWIAKLNSCAARKHRDFTFDAEDANTESQLRDAFDIEYADGGALVEGYWRRGQKHHGHSRREFAVTNVLATKFPPFAPVCLVLAEENGTTAWNFDDRADAEAFAARIGAEVRDGTCAEQNSICPRLRDPVYGTIDALGDDCIDFPNPCLFSAAVVRAAGPSQPGKAKGEWERDSCVDPEEPEDG
jgi:hypothetical protein